MFFIVKIGSTSLILGEEPLGMKSRLETSNILIQSKKKFFFFCLPWNILWICITAIQYDEITFSRIPFYAYFLISVVHLGHFLASSTSRPGTYLAPGWRASAYSAEHLQPRSWRLGDNEYRRKLGGKIKGECFLFICLFHV